MNKFKKFLGGGFVASALLVGLLAVSVVGAANPENVGVTVSVNNQLSLAVSTNSVALSGDPSTTANAAGALSTTVTTNNRTGYTLKVRGVAANFTSATSTDTIPLANLSTRTGAGSFVALSTSDQNIRATSARTSNSGDSAAWDMRLNIPWVDAVSDYSNTLVYTAAVNP